MALETQRLILRPLLAEDAPAVAQLAGRREIADTTLSIPHPYSEQQAREWIALHNGQNDSGNEVVFALTLKPDGELIGAMGMGSIDKEHSQAEMGFWIGVDWWGKGFATEAARALIRHGFDDLKLNRIYAHYMVRNPASGRVLAKIGMQREGLLRQRLRKWDVFEDVVAMAILKEDWAKLERPTSAPPHSREQFGPQRDFWWHRDFLDLMATRWRLPEASLLADIGCGRCHWSRLLYPYLRAPARLVGVDRERRWVTEAAEVFRDAFPNVPPELLTFIEGNATNLPLPDNSFDVVTCQTLLMHLARPKDALCEMLRILRRGGLLICVEPNNLWNHLAFTSLTAEEPVETLVRRFEFWLRYQRGKMSMGEGDHAIGDVLPGYFAKLGLVEIMVFQTDRAASLVPPYDSPSQQAVIQQEREWKATATGPWDREELRRLVQGGGGSADFFERAFAELVEKFRGEQKGITDGTLHAGFGGVTYLVSARKPS